MTASKKRKVLITGSAGFLGRMLAQRLATQGEDVLGFDVPAAVAARGIPMDGVRTVAGDLRRPEDVYRALEESGPPQAIVHGGGVSGSMVLRDDPAMIIDINVAGTVHLLEAARKLGVRRIVFCSSIMAYGRTQKQEEVSEASPLVPENVYGATKAACEALCHSYAAEFGLEPVLLRIAHVYGPGRMTTCPVREMVAGAIAGRPVHIPAAAATPRQFIHAEDVIDAVLAALQFEGGSYPAFNVAPGQSVILSELAELIGRTIAPVEVSFASEPVSSDYSTGLLSIERSREFLGWSPRTSLEAGLAGYASAMRAELTETGKA